MHLCSRFTAAPATVSTPSLDAATQTFSHTTATRDVPTQLSFMESLTSPSTLDALCPASARPVPSLLLDAAVQTSLHSVATHGASTQLPLTEFFVGCILSNDPFDCQALPSAHCNADSASPPLTLLRFAAPAAPAMLATVTRTLRPHVCYHSRHRVSRGMPTFEPLMVYLLKRHRCDLVCAHLSQLRPHSHMSVPPKWDTSCALSYYIQEKCKYRPCGNPQF